MAGPSRYNADIIRAHVKFLTDPPPEKKRRLSLSDKSSPKRGMSPSPVVQVAKTQSEHPNSAALKPPPKDAHKRTASLRNSEKPTGMTTISDSASTWTVKKPSVDLEKQIQIPWSKTFRPGFGVDALTGEFMARPALRYFKMSDASHPDKTRVSVRRLHWKDVVESRDEFEMSLGGTVNVPVAVGGASTKIASILSENATTSNMIIEYKVEADFLPDYVPRDVRLKAGLEKLSDADFREQFGDYYIAGVQKGYSCRMVVVCKVDEEGVTETREKEAKALVGGYFEAGIKLADVNKRAKGFTFQNVLVDAEGCSVDAGSVFSVGVGEAPQTLTKILKNAPGVPRVAFLYHYSLLDSCNLSRRVEVRKDRFNKARSMRNIYNYLQTCLLHPALQPFAFESRKIRAVHQRFEEQRSAIVRLANDDKRTAKDIESLEKDLKTWKEKADAYIKRYDFICAVTKMDKGIVAQPPTVVDRQLFCRWDCGKTGALKTLDELESYKLITFENNYKAFELEWQSPMTDEPSTLRQLFKGTVPRETMSFTAQNTAPPLPPSPFMPAPKSKRLAKPRPEQSSLASQEQEHDDPGTFAFSLHNHKPILVLGWSISCYWPDHKTPPTIEVEHPNNCIFADQLRVSVDCSRATRWWCKVTFVIKSSYNFSDVW
ncbi:hypothetical protein C8F01DRAFT_467053 [Mycena amicta]|nr:hypothetical protein C8F01DRAFT_467053 [Mycena amicta]